MRATVVPKVLARTYSRECALGDCGTRPTLSPDKLLALWSALGIRVYVDRVAA